MEYMTQATLMIDYDAFTFTTPANARPYNGIFEA